MASNGGNMKDKSKKTSIVVIIGAVISNYYSDILRFFTFYKDLRSASYQLANVFENLILVAIAFGGLFFTGKRGFVQAFKELGLKMPVKRALVFGLLATLPMSVGFAFTSNLNPKFSFTNIILLTVLFPFIEELFYRGYVFRQLFRRAKWRFGYAIIIPTLIFSLGHWFQAESAMELVGVLAITGLGSLLFCWVFVRWKDNLWVPFALHFFMNFWWETFAVDTNALGDWFANVVRFASVLLCVILTIYKDKVWKPLPLESENIQEFELEKVAATDDLAMRYCL